MSALNDANTRTAITERMLAVTEVFSPNHAASWDDHPEMDESFLHLVRIDLERLCMCIERRLQEKYQTHEPTDYGRAEL